MPWNTKLYNAPCDNYPTDGTKTSDVTQSPYNVFSTKHSSITFSQHTITIILTVYSEQFLKQCAVNNVLEVPYRSRGTRSLSFQLHRTDNSKRVSCVSSVRMYSLAKGDFEEISPDAK